MRLGDAHPRHRTRATAVAAATTPVAPLAAAGGFAYVDPDEPAAHRRIVAVRAHGPGSATLVRLMAVESARSVPRAANPPGPTSR